MALEFNPFASARVGDWQTMSVRRGGQRPVAGLALRTFRVTAVQGDEVTVEAETLLPTGERVDQTTLTFSRSHGPSLESYGLVPGPLLDVRMGLDWHDRPGRRFERCTQVRWRTEAGDTATQTILKLHPTVKGMGLVFLTMEVVRPGPMHWVDWELVGYGTATATLWGRTEAEVVAPVGPTSEQRSRWVDRGRGIAFDLPRFSGPREGEAALPLTVLAAGEIQVKVVRQALPQLRIREQVMKDCTREGLILREEAKVQLGDRLGVIYDCGGSEVKPRMLYLSLPGTPRSYFVRCTASPTGFPELEAGFRTCLESLRMGPTIERSAEGVAALYVDEANGFSLRLPPGPPPTGEQPRLLVRFCGAPVLEAIREVVELFEVPAAVTPEQLARGGALGAHTRIVANRAVRIGAREGRLLDLESAAPGAPPLRGRALAISGEERTWLLVCSIWKDDFARHEAEVQACLESVELGR